MMYSFTLRNKVEKRFSFTGQSQWQHTMFTVEEVRLPPFHRKRCLDQIVCPMLSAHHEAMPASFPSQVLGHSVLGCSLQYKGLSQLPATRQDQVWLSGPSLFSPTNHLMSCPLHPPSALSLPCVTLQMKTEINSQR